MGGTNNDADDVDKDNLHPGHSRKVASRDEEAQHIRENNDAPMSPVMKPKAEVVPTTTPKENADSDKTPTSSQTKRKKHHHHHHSNDVNTSSPPSVPNLADIISEPPEPDSKLPYREERRRREQQQREVNGDDASGFLEDLLAENDNDENGETSDVRPGAVRINMDGNDHEDDDDDLDNLEKNGPGRVTRSSEFFNATTDKQKHHKHGSEGSNRRSTTRGVSSSAEMATLPRAEHVTAMLIDGQEPEDYRKAAEKDAENAILANMPRADLLGDKEELIQKQKQRRKIRGFMALFVVLLVIVGVAIGVIKGTDRSNTSVGPAPPIDPTTFDNITATEDLCENAIPLDFPSNDTVTGSTSDATSDTSLLGVCGDLSRNGAFGVWYSLGGTGSPLSLSTCYGSNFDTQISVYSGSSCSFATCLESNDQRTKCGTDGSQVTFLAEQGVQYFIMIHGLRRASGVFTLLIEELTDNSQCSQATQITDTNPKGEISVFGSTKYSMIDDSLNECQEASITSPGVWYSFVPESTRFVQARLDDFKGTVTVYSGECDELRCVTADSFGKAMWTASEGTRYLIFVHGAGKATGDFSLSILAGGLLSPPADTNNQCLLSQRLDTPRQGTKISVTDSTVNGLLPEGVPGCGKLLDPSVAPGLWYSVVGNGAGIRASTCDTESGFIARVAVYEGNCLDLICIDGGDQNCGEESSVVWIGDVGKEYFILVEGLEARVGEFNLTLEEIIPESSSDCSSPILIPLTDTAILGSTENGVFDNVGLCTDAALSSPSVWYSVEGTGGTMSVSTCDPKSDNFAKLEVYTGRCNSLNCVPIQRYQCGNQMLATWDTTLGETYLLQIYGSGIPNDEDFTLNVDELLGNHECSKASENLVPGAIVRGSTILWSPGGSNSCSELDESGSWYKITVPADQTVTLSACSSITNFQTKLTVFQGFSCGLLSCVGSNNGRSCGDGSFVTWDASSSRTYYVLVQGAGSFETGNYELSLGIENDVCATALGPIDVGGNPVLGSTEYATAGDGDLRCFSSSLSVDGPAVWYTIVGANSLLKASTCSPQTNFDTRISIYKGPCQALTCVGGNDNDEECGDASSVSWFATQGETYHILVHGVEKGGFALAITEVDSSCAMAQPVYVPGASETAFSPRSVSETFIDACSGDVVSNQVGAWYSIAGTGGPMRFDGCETGEFSNEDASLTVYTDDCTVLSCMADSESACSLVVDTFFGEDYSVYLESSSDNVASPLELNVYANNDRCNSAFGPLKRGDVVRGSTFDATIDSIELCGNMTARGAGVWYSLIGTDESLTVFTCSEFTDFDTQMSLFQGDDCGNLSCIASRDDNCGTATWMEHFFEKGHRFYILVSGKPGPRSVGNFELHVL